ncbi:hypothetical protein KA005_54010 [bacterium]|nr:hypothetical protein [bacterium]
MSTAMKVKRNVTRITKKKKLDEMNRTEGCLLATCFYRLMFNKMHGRNPKPSECAESCCYHPLYAPAAKSSLGRSIVPEPF